MLPLAHCCLAFWLLLQASGNFSRRTPASMPPSQTLRIGVLAYRGVERALQDCNRMQSISLPGSLRQRFDVVPLNYAEINAAVRGWHQSTC